MKNIKLTLPGDDFTRSDAIRAKKTDGTLAKEVTDIVCQKQKYVSFQAPSDTPPKQFAQTVCDVANKNFDETRREIDVHLMDCLIARDGRAESFPDVSDGPGLFFENVHTADNLSFMYFGEDFEVTEPEKGNFVLARKGGDLVYRDSFTPRDMPEYAKRKKELNNSPAAKKLEKIEGGTPEHPVILCAVLLVLLAAAGFSLFCLIWEMAAGAMTNGPLKTLLEGLAGFPRTAVELLLLPAQVYADTEEWGFMLTALSAVFLGMLIALVRTIRLSRLHGQARQLERELEALEDENERWKAQCVQLSKQWHKAWFAWCREHMDDDLSATDLAAFLRAAF